MKVTVNNQCICPVNVMVGVQHMFSNCRDGSHTYGKTIVALGLFTVSGLLVCLDWLLMNWTGHG